MPEWTSSAARELEKYLSRARNALDAEETDADEVIDDLRRHVQEKVKEKKLSRVTDKDIRAIVRKVGLPQSAAADRKAKKSPPKSIGRAEFAFLRRVIAFGLDVLLLKGTGMLLALVFFSFFVWLGSYGRLFGLLVAVSYAGILNSSLGRGQTLGKRLLNIRVVDGQGRFLTPLKACLRGFVLFAPRLVDHSLASTSLLAPIAIALAGMTVYLFLFNRRTRQSLHDVVVDSYVVTVPVRGIVDARPIWKLHWVVLLIWIVGAIPSHVYLTRLPERKQLKAVQSAIAESKVINGREVSLKELVKSIKIETDVKLDGDTSSTTFHFEENLTSINLEFIHDSEGNTTGAKKKLQILDAEVRLRQPAEVAEDTARAIAAIVLKEYPPARDKDRLVVRMKYGYDIGVVSAWHTRSFERSPAEWEKLLASDRK